MKSTGVTRGDGLSVSVYTRMIPAAEKEPDLTLSSSLCRLGRSTGNAHTRNLLTDHGRVVLLDFESSAIGPREWDLLDLLPTAIATDRYGLPLSTTSSSRR